MLVQASKCSEVIFEYFRKFSKALLILPNFELKPDMTKKFQTLMKVKKTNLSAHTFSVTG